MTLGGMIVYTGIRWRHFRRLRALAKSDLKAFYAASDGDATRLGKRMAAVSFLFMAGSIVAIVWIFATHV